MRDNKVYKTVNVRGQVWMAENLNYADSVATPSLKGRSWCYGNVDKNCDVAGRLYTWAAAIDSVGLLHDAENPQLCGDGRDCFMSDVVQGVCPEGWHLPSKNEWDDLKNSFAKELLSSVKPAVEMMPTVGWTLAKKTIESYSYWNRSGFSAIPAGYMYPDDDGEVGFSRSGRQTLFWSSTQAPDIRNAYKLALYDDIDPPSISGARRMGGYSVRCIKNGTYTKAPSWTVPKEYQFNPSVEYGELVDKRDGHVYKTVMIGEQNWMAENLNYIPDVGGSLCYGDDTLHCNKAGRLYTMKAALGCTSDDKSCSFNSKVCPTGWRVPSKTDWNTLLDAVGGIDNAAEALLSRVGWYSDDERLDEYGFSMISTGYSEGISYGAKDFGSRSGFWVATVDKCYARSDYVCGVTLVTYSGAQKFSYSYGSSELHAIRCVQYAK